jgi:hypothetical protein
MGGQRTEATPHKMGTTHRNAPAPGAMENTRLHAQNSQLSQLQFSNTSRQGTRKHWYGRGPAKHMVEVEWNDIYGIP